MTYSLEDRLTLYVSFVSVSLSCYKFILINKLNQSFMFGFLWLIVFFIFLATVWATDFDIATQFNKRFTRIFSNCYKFNTLFINDIIDDKKDLNVYK
ncbi:hypothetical protein JCM12856_31780 [Spirochaeta dissipatitropha]